MAVDVRLKTLRSVLAVSWKRLPGQYARLAAAPKTGKRRSNTRNQRRFSLQHVFRHILTTSPLFCAVNSWFSTRPVFDEYAGIAISNPGSGRVNHSQTKASDLPNIFWICFIQIIYFAEFRFDLRCDFLCCSQNPLQKDSDRRFHAFEMIVSKFQWFFRWSAALRRLSTENSRNSCPRSRFR